MSNDIVTRLRELAKKQAAEWLDPTDAPLTMYQVAADEIERLRAWNVEITKLLKQAQVCMDIWQKSEDELIEFHQGKSVEALMKQADEIEYLQALVSTWENIAISLWRELILTDDELDMINAAYDRKFSQ